MSLEAIPAWRLRRRERIVGAAAALFAHGSYRDVQMDQVARAAGIGKATLYRYFPSKEDLYLETLDEALLALEQRLRQIAAGSAAPAETLAAMIRALVATLSERLAPLRLLGDEDPLLAEQTRRLMRGRLREIGETVGSVLRRGMADGTFRTLDPELLPPLLFGMIGGGAMSLPELPREHLAESVIDLLLHGGIAAPPSGIGRGAAPAPRRGLEAPDPRHGVPGPAALGGALPRAPQTPSGTAGEREP